MNPQIETLLDSIRAQATCLQILPSLNGKNLLISDIDTLKRLIADSDASKTLSVRDHFAGQIFSVTTSRPEFKMDRFTARDAAANAYVVADLMLEARKSSTPQTDV